MTAHDAESADSLLRENALARAVNAELIGQLTDLRAQLAAQQALLTRAARIEARALALMHTLAAQSVCIPIPGFAEAYVALRDALKRAMEEEGETDAQRYEREHGEPPF